MTDKAKRQFFSEHGYIIMSGNLSEGFVAYGVYADFEEAAAACEGAGDAWIMSLGSPEEAEVEL